MSNDKRMTAERIAELRGFIAEAKAGAEKARADDDISNQDDGMRIAAEALDALDAATDRAVTAEASMGVVDAFLGAEIRRADTEKARADAAERRLAAFDALAASVIIEGDYADGDAHGAPVPAADASLNALIRTCFEVPRLARKLLGAEARAAQGAADTELLRAWGHAEVDWNAAGRAPMNSDNPAFVKQARLRREVEARALALATSPGALADGAAGEDGVAPERCPTILDTSGHHFGQGQCEGAAGHAGKHLVDGDEYEEQSDAPTHRAVGIPADELALADVPVPAGEAAAFLAGLGAQSDALVALRDYVARCRAEKNDAIAGGIDEDSAFQALLFGRLDGAAALLAIAERTLPAAIRAAEASAHHTTVTAIDINLGSRLFPRDDETMLDALDRHMREAEQHRAALRALVEADRSTDAQRLGEAWRVARERVAGK